MLKKAFDNAKIKKINYAKDRKLSKQRFTCRHDSDFQLASKELLRSVPCKQIGKLVIWKPNLYKK